MKNSKLYRVFRSLSLQEKRDLDKIVQSPYLNRRKEVADLYVYLRKMEGKSQIDYHKATVYQAVFGNAKYDDTKMRYSLSFLLKLIEDYLAQKAIPNSDFQQKLHLAKAYRERNLEKHFSQSLTAARSELKKMPKDQQYYYLNYQIEMEQYAFNSDQKRSTENNLQDLSDNFDIQFLANKLKQSCLLLSHQAVYKVDYDAGLLPLVLDFLKDSAYLDIPAIAIYYYCYKALTEESDEDFQRLKIQLLDYQQQFPRDEMTNLLLLAINFCIKQLNTGKKEYVQEAFSLYKMGLESKLLIPKNILNRFVYKNTIALGLRLGELEWIEQFINEFHLFVEKRYRKNYYQYNLARLCFFKKDYKQAMSLLVTVDSTDLLLNIDAKILLLKMYYELGEYDALEALLASFKTFLHRKKVMGYHQQNYLTIIDFTKKMLYLKPNHPALKKELAEAIQQSNVSEKDWLLEQL